jgi:hypothetical protein
MTDKPVPRSEDADRIITLLRRALTRLDTVEKRLAAVEERLHWLDDLPEEVQTLQGLAHRGVVDQRLMEQQVLSKLTNLMDKRLAQLQKK